MKVLKFGGTSVGSPERMMQVADIIAGVQGKKIVVLSAVSGTTNTLVSMSDYCENEQKDEAKKVAEELHSKYHEFVKNLYKDEAYVKSNIEFIDQKFSDINNLIEERFTEQVAKMFVAQGELISTHLFTEYLSSIGKSAVLLPALDFMALDEYAEPDLKTTKVKLENLLSSLDENVIVTQGYIARNAAGGTDNLRRGGSDYTATIVGAVLKVEEVQIWTDIDGMHNNDPRLVDNTRPLAHLSFEEASELAYFGAKVLHPSCIVPAQMNEVPVRIKNTMDPEAHGTLISNETEPEKVKALAAKDHITAIKIKSNRMVMAYGFLKRVFEVFEKYRTPIDMITTSEIAVSLTIDNSDHLKEIIEEIGKYATVEVDREQAIICIVGDHIASRKGVGTAIFEAMEEIPIRMISYGGSRNNISLLVPHDYMKDSLIKLHKALF
ncbi:aspartate kinase [Marinoscillum pacificum]|uniref:aspartate kinase n=1 Tax=Marinoscillum pacificum TaxID=392723 RepID=UPI002157D4B6|nr:aspartate kinase [Marinoscillum pacificum]